MTKLAPQRAGKRPCTGTELLIVQPAVVMMARPLGGSPVIWILLVAEVADPGDEWLMAFLARPGDGVALVLERGQHVVGTVFDNVVLDRAVPGTSLGTGFDIDIRHRSTPLLGGTDEQDFDLRCVPPERSNQSRWS